jgi:DNA-binding MarR family transcriptional regulator
MADSKSRRARSAAPAKRPAAAPDLIDEPGHLLRRAHQAAVAAFHEAHGRGVTPVQYAVMRALADRPGIDQVTLADAVALDTSTTADIAARLDAKGWIERELLPRRQRSLRLTPQGHDVLRSMLPHVQPMYEAFLAPLSAAQRGQLIRLLRRLVQP